MVSAAENVKTTSEQHTLLMLVEDIEDAGRSAVAAASHE